MIAQASRFRDALTPASKATYLLWRALGRLPVARELPVTVRLRNGTVLSVRPPPTSDLDVAYELFNTEVYSIAKSRLGQTAVRTIVDVGANVGFSIAYFARSFPDARFIAFEPHPRNLRALRRNVALNSLDGRVSVHGAAAATRPCVLELTDDESHSSTLVPVRGAASVIQVPGEDLFAALGDTPVDLLKMDIEGGEHALLEDARLRQQRPRAIIMEWHCTADYPDGEAHCNARLRDCGYRVDSFKHMGDTGLLWAELDS
jgi:FkbM family methyltransferase